MSRAVVGKWGKNLAIRLPGEIVQAIGLCDGERVEIEAHDGDILIRRPAPQFALEELVPTARAPKNGGPLYAGAFDWGPDIGRETVEE